MARRNAKNRNYVVKSALRWMTVNMQQTQKRLNILDLRDSPWVDGPGRTILDCAQSLEGERFHFIIGSFSGGAQKTSEYAEEAKRRQLELAVIKETKAFDMNVVRQINDLINQHDIDVVHTHDFRYNLYGLYCARKKSIPVISTVHGWIANDLKGKLYRLIDKIQLRFFDHIVSVSARTAGLLKKAWINNKKLTIISNALKTEQYLPDKQNNAFRKELDASDNTLLIANIGRLSPEKGQLAFLQAGLAVYQQNPNIKLILIGIGPDETILQDFVQQNNMQDYVVFAGFRKDMIDIYNSIDLVVQSSYTEGMPNVVLEALLMEVAVIATDVGGTAEVLQDQKTGLLIQAGDHDELVKQIQLFVSQPDKLRGMARQGRSHMLQDFSHTNRVTKLSQVYLATCAG